MNQKQALLKYLRIRPRAGITQLDASQVLGIQRLSERIRELEALGHVIDRTRERVINRYGHLSQPVRYRLIK